MPKLKEKDDKYKKLKVLIGGHMSLMELNDEQLAYRLGCCRQTVTARRRDPSKMTLDELAHYARVLNIPTDELRAAVPTR